MSNLQKDLVTDYFTEYPVLRYLMPKVVNIRNEDITHRTFIIRQACWVMSQIFKADDSIFKKEIFRGTQETVDVPALDLSSDDVAILGIVLRCAQKVQNAGTSKLDFTKILKDSNIVHTVVNAASTYDDLLTSFVDESNFLGTNKIIAIKYLLTLNTGKLNSIIIPSQGAAEIVGIMANIAYDCAPFIQVNALELVKFEVSKDAIEVGGSFAIANNNSFINALGPVISKTTNTYAFSLNENGLYVLKTIDRYGKVIEDNFDATYVNMTKGNDFCRTFGSSKGNTADKCAKMYAECLGSNMHDTEKCRTNFRELKSVSKNLKGWNSLSSEQKRYAAYRVLLGLGITGNYDERGDYSYIKENKAYLSDSQIVASLGISSTDLKKQDKVEYIKKLMETVNVIQSQNVSSLSNRPEHGPDHRPEKEPEHRPSVLMMSPVMHNPLMMVIPQLFGSMRAQHGGYEENMNTNLIQYGGGVEDAARIVANIRGKIELLASKGRALNANTKKVIEDKIEKFGALAIEITNLDSVLVNFLVASSQFPNKDIVFTQKDVENIKEKLDAKKRDMNKKLDKFAKLDAKLVVSMN